MGAFDQELGAFFATAARTHLLILIQSHAISSSAVWHNHTGIISCLAYNPDRSGMLAAGAYSGVAALYDAATLAPMALLPDGHSAGITQASS